MPLFLPPKTGQRHPKSLQTGQIRHCKWHLLVVKYSYFENVVWRADCLLKSLQRWPKSNVKLTPKAAQQSLGWDLLSVDRNSEGSSSDIRIKIQQLMTFRGFYWVAAHLDPAQTLQSILFTPNKSRNWLKAIARLTHDMCAGHTCSGWATTQWEPTLQPSWREAAIQLLHQLLVEKYSSSVHCSPRARLFSKVLQVFWLVFFFFLVVVGSILRANIRSFDVTINHSAGSNQRWGTEVL